MIQLELTTALAIYGAIIAGGACAIWLYTEITTRHAYHVLEHQYVWHCVYCTYTYLDQDAETVSQCPRCHSFNSAGDKGARLIKPSRTAVVPQPLPADTEQPRRNPSRGKRPGARRRGPRRRR